MTSLVWLTFRRILTVNGTSRSMKRRLDAVLRRVVLIIFDNSIQCLIQSCVVVFSWWLAHERYRFQLWMHCWWGQWLCPWWSSPAPLFVDSETEPFSCEGWTLSLEIVSLWNYIFDAWGPCIYRWWGWRPLLIDDVRSYCTCWWMEVTTAIYLWCQSRTFADLSTTGLRNKVWVSPMLKGSIYPQDVSIGRRTLVVTFAGEHYF